MDKTYLQEAFHAMELLEEEDFKLDDVGVRDLLDFKDYDELNDIVDVIDPEAETESDLEDTYIGKVILECEVCHSPIFKDITEVDVDEDGDLVNIEDECPICHSQDGFKIIGQVAPFKEDPEIKVEIEDKPEEAEEEVEEETIDESLKLNEGGDADIEDEEIDFEEPEEEAEEEIEEESVEEKIDAVADAVAEVADKVEEIADAVVETEAPEEEVEIEDVTDDEIEDIADVEGEEAEEVEDIDEAVNMVDNKPFAVRNKDKKPCDDGECEKEEKEEDSEQLTEDDKLNYQQKLVDNRTGDEVTISGKDSVELKNNVRKFEQSHGGSSRYDEVEEEKHNVNEGIEKIDLETEDKIIHVSEEEKPEIPDAEMMVPVSDEIEAELTADDAEEVADDMADEIAEEPIEADNEDENVDYELDDFEENDFDELGESYLKRVYENVESFKTAKVSTEGNTLMVEGIIKFNSGKEKATQFIFEASEATREGKVRFIGENAQISRGKKSFTLSGKMDGTKFIAESLNYNYRAKDVDGNSTRLYGTIKKGE